MNIGIIYRIYYGDLSYVGSTIDLTKRIRDHIRKKKCSSKEIICFDDYEVEILAEIYYVENQHDINLRNLEREYMEQYKCVNKNRAIITEEERKKEMKEYQKEYEKTDKRKEYKKEYNKEYNKSDKYKEYQKEYQKSDKKKEYKKEYNKKYRLKNNAT